MILTRAPLHRLERLYPQTVTDTPTAMYWLSAHPVTYEIAAISRLVSIVLRQFVCSFLGHSVDHQQNSFGRPRGRT